jgi:hypothetical protein
MKPRAASVLPVHQVSDGLPAGDAQAPQPALLPYAAAEPGFLSSLPTRLGLVFAALVVPAVLATAGWGMPDREGVRTFGGAGAAVFGTSALVCCALGHRHDRRPVSTSRGRNAAAFMLLCCVILGSVGVIFGSVAVLNQATTRSYDCYSPRTLCHRNLRQVSLAVLLYANQNNGRLPDTLDDLLQAGDVTSDVFICPVQAANPPPGGTIPYVYLGKGMKNDIGPDVVVLHDRPIDHNDGMNFAYGYGHVEWHDLKLSKKILAELDAGYNPPRPEKLR